MNGDFSDKLGQILSNPAMMAQIKALADTMTAGEESPSAAEAVSAAEAPKEDIPAVSAERPSVPAFFTPSPSFEKNMKNTCALLTALKPFLDARRCEKIDKMLSMIRFAEMAGKLGSFF